jgi:hypothetical protein
MGVDRLVEVPLRHVELKAGQQIMHLIIGFGGPEVSR